MLQAIFMILFEFFFFFQIDGEYISNGIFDKRIENNNRLPVRRELVSVLPQGRIVKSYIPREHLNENKYSSKLTFGNSACRKNRIVLLKKYF